MSTAKKPLPTLAELVAKFGDPNEAYEKDSLNVLLNQQPPANWIQEHPLAKVKNDYNVEVPARYLPIDKIEYLLTRIYQNWRIEVLRECIMFNSIVVTVRLHVQNPITNEWTFQDGIGAKSVQTDKGKSAADLSAIKDAAVQMAAPAAKSYAIKDAAEHLGAIFGKDLNRKNVIQFTGAHPEPSLTERMGMSTDPAAEYKVSAIVTAPENNSLFNDL